MFRKKKRHIHSRATIVIAPAKTLTSGSVGPKDVAIFTENMTAVEALARREGIPVTTARIGGLTTVKYEDSKGKTCVVSCDANTKKYNEGYVDIRGPLKGKAAESPFKLVNVHFNTAFAIIKGDWEVNPKNTNVKEAKFLSLWDDDVTVSAKCRVNTKTRKVFDIEPLDMTGYDVENFAGERVVIGDDVYRVTTTGKDADCYWRHPYSVRTTNAV